MDLDSNAVALKSFSLRRRDIAIEEDVGNPGQNQKVPRRLTMTEILAEAVRPEGNRQQCLPERAT